jgi:hypothetical protein
MPTARKVPVGSIFIQEGRPLLMGSSPKLAIVGPDCTSQKRSIPLVSSFCRETRRVPALLMVSATTVLPSTALLVMGCPVAVVIE